ncbi:hypothetical protein AUC71_06305 [Methyloceanibacter marginalis]|uniref:Uncharacterized protein n=1 Tax=Methyloceanibacter marginalis TaxID=1774971 RepID=A0A1E3WDY2_9HYPH|nr:hypothetical protein AUC71_06305 [Methyloceanibacter marginalis]
MAVDGLLMGVQQARIARPADQGSAVGFRAERGQCGVQLTQILLRLELGEEDSCLDAGLGQSVFHQSEDLRRRGRRGAQNQRARCRGVRLADPLDKVRHRFQMPVEISLSEIP